MTGSTSPQPLLRWAALAGPVVAVVGLISYFTVFAGIPALRDVPWVNLPMVAAGLALSIWALTARRSVWRWLGAALSTVCAAALVGYVFVLSSMLPETSRVVAVDDRVADLELPDHTGTVTRIPVRSDRTLLVFYRGHW